MQASLDVEIKSRADAVRAKKKMESQLNDTELQLDHANKNLQEQLKLVRKLQVTIKVRFRLIGAKCFVIIYVYLFWKKIKNTTHICRYALMLYIAFKAENITITLRRKL